MVDAVIRQPKPDIDATELFRVITTGFPPITANEVTGKTSATTATQKLRHGLGRAYRGVIGPVSQDQAITFAWLRADDQAEPETFIYFKQSAATATNLTVWVY